MNAPAPLLRNAPLLLRETSDGIACLTMNRPEQRNTLSEAMLTVAMRPYPRRVLVGAQRPTADG